MNSYHVNIGTLTPICKHPDLAVIPTETKKVLERLANRRDVFVAIISGRSVANVKQMVGIEGKMYKSSLEIKSIALRMKPMRHII